MKRSLFSILSLCVIAVCLSGCGGDDAEIPDGHQAGDKRENPPAPIKAPSEDVGETFKGD